MSTLSPKDRVSLCSFTFSDGRRCRTPRTRNHPRLCFYHAQKETRARTAKTLGKDLAYFFSGDYLSACDLSTALAHLIPAVVRGDVKPKTAHTVAYLAQTLMQAIHLSKHEYINAFGTDGWRKSVRNSVNGNRDYLFPPDPEPEESESPQPQPQPAQPQTQAQQPASVSPSNPPQPTPVPHPFRGEAFRPASPPQPAATPNPFGKATPPLPAEIPASCRSAGPDWVGERSDERPTRRASPESYREEPAFSELPAGHSFTPSPEGSFATRHSPLPQSSHPAPATQFARPEAPATQPDKPLRIGPSTPQPAPNRGAHALHFDHGCRLLIDGKPF